MLANTRTKVSSAIFVSMALGFSATPALAKTYNVVFAGKVVEVDCPENPEGHNLTWVNQNCTAVRVGSRSPAAPMRTLKDAKQ
jgi:hypothetical protein